MCDRHEAFALAAGDLIFTCVRSPKLTAKSDYCTSFNVQGHFHKAL